MFADPAARGVSGSLRLTGPRPMVIDDVVILQTPGADRADALVAAVPATTLDALLERVGSSDVYFVTLQ